MRPSLKIKQMENNMFGMKLPDLLSNNPFDALKIFNNSQAILQNNIKYQKACIAYHQALRDMLEVIDDNAKILNNNETQNTR